MKQQASVPQFSPEFEASCGAGWIVSVRYFYDNGEPVRVLHSLSSFPTQDEAMAYTAGINGRLS